MGEPTREEVERVVAGLTDAQRREVEIFGRMTCRYRSVFRSTGDALARIGVLRYVGVTSYEMTILGRAVAAALRREEG